MTHDEILSLARQAGFRTGVTYLADGTKCADFAESVGANCLHNLEQFAALVAAAELEECAKACESCADYWQKLGDIMREDAADDCAIAIRERSGSGGKS